LLLKLVKLRGEGHSAAGWGIGGSVELQTAGQSPFLRAMAAANCAAPPNASAGQYAISNCKPLLFGFSCRLRYINVQTFNRYYFYSFYYYYVNKNNVKRVIHRWI